MDSATARPRIPPLELAACRKRATIRRPGGIWALREVNVDIRRASGRNHRAKRRRQVHSVKISVASPSREGRVRLRGRRRASWVATGFHPELTGRENVFMNGAILGMSDRNHTEIRQVVAFCRVEKFLDTPVKHFSSGMYVRLAFAVAAHLAGEFSCGRGAGRWEMRRSRKCLSTDGRRGPHRPYGAVRVS